MKINRRDLILVIIVVAAAALSFIGMKIFAGDEGGTVQITIDGDVYGTYSLDEDQTITVSNDYGTNIVVIENGKVHMEEADCPDGYCEDQGEINRSNQTIVCLPHKLVVSIISSQEDDDMDVIVQ